jgi:hypothetical protein
MRRCFAAFRQIADRFCRVFIIIDAIMNRMANYAGQDTSFAVPQRLLTGLDT